MGFIHSAKHLSNFQQIIGTQSKDSKDPQGLGRWWAIWWATVYVKAAVKPGHHIFNDRALVLAFLMVP